MVRQKRGHLARLEVHHCNGKDQAERIEDIPKSGKHQKSVTARSSELRPGDRSTPQTVLFQIDDNSGPTSQEEDHNSQRLFFLGPLRLLPYLFRLFFLNFHNIVLELH